MNLKRAIVVDDVTVFDKTLVYIGHGDNLPKNEVELQLLSRVAKS